MNNYIIVAENLGDIKPLLGTLGTWSQLSSTTYFLQTNTNYKDIYNRFNPMEGSNEQLHIFGATHPYLGFGQHSVTEHCNKVLN